MSDVVTLGRNRSCALARGGITEAHQDLCTLHTTKASTSQVSCIAHWKRKHRVHYLYPVYSPATVTIIRQSITIVSWSGLRIVTLAPNWLKLAQNNQIKMSIDEIHINFYQRFSIFLTIFARRLAILIRKSFRH